MKIDFSQYSDRLSKTLSYIKSLELQAKEGDGFILLNLSEISPFIVQTTKLINQLKEQEFDTSFIKKYQKGLEDHKKTLMLLFDKRIKKVSVINGNAKILAELLKKIVDLQGIESDKQRTLAEKILKGLNETLALKWIDSIETKEDKDLCINFKEFLTNINIDNVLHSKEELSSFKDKMTSFAFRYFNHNEELVEVSKIHPQLFNDMDLSFSAIISSLIVDLEKNGVVFNTDEAEEEQA